MRVATAKSGSAVQKVAGNKSKGKKVAFQVVAEPGSQVFVAGTFNGWDPLQHPLREQPERGVYAATLVLPPERHEYKFVVNGEWRHDPSCSECTSNVHGSQNSVLVV